MSDKKSDVKYQTMIQAAPLPMAIARVSDGRILYANAHLCSLFGVSAKDILTYSSTDFYYDPADRQALIKKFANDGRISNYEIQAKKADGTPFWEVVSIEPLIYNGEDALLVMFWDITERKNLENALRESDEKFKAIFNNAHDGIILADVETMRFHLSNGVFRSMLGYTQEELQSLTVPDLHPAEDWPSVREKFRKRADGELTLVSNSPVKRKDGTVFTADIAASPVMLRGKKYLIGMFRDVTQRRRMEEALTKSNRQQEAILNNIPDMAWLKDDESKFIMANETVARTCGMRPEDLVGKTDLDLFPKALAEQYRADDREVMKTGKRKIVEEPFVDKEGNETWIETIKTPICNEEGVILGTAGIARDITERKRREAEYRAILQTTMEGFWVSDMKGRFLDVNDAYSRLIGYSREELLAMGIPDVEAVENPEDTARHIGKVLATGSDRFESRHRKKDGAILDLEISATYLNVNGGRIYVFLRDITEIKSNEKVLRALAKFPDENPNPVLRVSREGAVMYANKSSLPLLKTWETEVGRLLPDHLREAVTDVLRSGLSRQLEVVCEKLIFSVVFAPILELGYVNIYGMDITERKWNEGIISDALEFNKKIIENAPVGIAIYNSDGQCIAENDALTTIIGGSREQVLALNFRRIESWKKSGMLDVAELALSENSPKSVEILLHTTFGRDLWAQAVFTPFVSRGERHLMVMLNDMTERRKMEEDLKKYSEELENMVFKRTAELEEKTKQAEAASRAKTDFLANMSHELRTPLNSIIGFSDILRKAKAEKLTDDQQGYIEDIWESGRHLLRIINDVLAYAQLDLRVSKLEPSEFILQEALKKALDQFAGIAAQKDIALSADVPESIGTVIADRNKIAQVVAHLVENAIKFTPRGGSVRVEARRGAGGKGQGQRENALTRDPGPLAPENDFLEISVTDTGIGIAQQDMAKLFQPFTQLSPALKKTSEGAGLGLSICRKYAELHGGTIRVEGEPGKGSKFIVRIPRTAPEKQGD